MADCRICVQDCSIHEDVWKALKENCRNYKPKPMTNADRIRAMSDEKLAEYHAEKFGCPHDPILFGCRMETIGCIGCWLDWLRQEASDG